MKYNHAATKILSADDAVMLQKRGWQAADLHVHTLFSPDVIAARSMHPERLYQTAKENGMDFVTFTDHDSIVAYDHLRPGKKGLVRGVEIKIKDMKSVGHTIHINIYDLDNDQFEIIVNLSEKGNLQSLLGYLKKQELPFVYNHPLWFEPGEKPNLAVIPDLIRRFPVVEYNMNRVRRKNEIVVELARKYGTGLIAATDTHSGMIGHAYTLSRGKNFKEFYDSICRGESFIVVKDLTKNALVQEMKMWLDLMSNQDMILKNKKVSTGIRHLDRLISILASKSFREFPRAYSAALCAMHKISSSGLPATLYIKREALQLYNIEHKMGIQFQDRSNNRMVQDLPKLH